MDPSPDRNRPDGTTDAARARALADGDPSALAGIVRVWKDPLDRYLSRLCGHCHGDRDDLLQEIFLKVYRHIHLYDPDLPFSAWIYRICRNEAYDRMRSHRNTPDAEMPEEIAESLWGTMAPLPDAPLASAETARGIREIVDSMPDKLRDVFVLRFFEEKEYAEIGDILRENTNTVATRIRRSRQWFVERAARRGMAPPEHTNHSAGRRTP
jgi:RNA polymerase sigma-70 factor (ECF subfamily)